MKNHTSTSTFRLIHISVAIVLAWYASPALAADEHPVMQEIVQKARSECASINGGQFHMADQAISWHDFSGDGQAEAVVDAAWFSCSTATSLWGGSAGTLLWVLVEGEANEYQAHKWRVVDVDGQKVLLLAVHPSACGETIGPCYRALVWDGGFRSPR